MRCRLYRRSLSSYIDGELRGKRKDRLVSHLDRCSKCSQEHVKLLELKELLGGLNEYEVPEQFSERLHARLVEEERDMSEGRSWSVGRILLSAGASALAVLIIFLGIKMWTPTMKSMDKEESIGSSEMNTSPSDSGGSMPEKGYDDAESDAYEGEDSAASERASVDEIMVAEVDRKLIKTAYITMETLDFDITISEVSSKVNMMQGYVQSSSIEGVSRRKSDKSKRHATYVIRIPTTNLETFTQALDDIADITHREIYAEDITSKYFDTEARLKSLQIQEERLLRILSEADMLQDVIEIERELSKVRYEIENYTGTLKKWDNLVDYSTIHISIYEVEKLKVELEGRFFERVSKGYIRSIKNLGKTFEDIFAFIIIWSPYIIVLGLLIWLIKFMLLDRRSRRNKNDDNK